MTTKFLTVICPAKRHLENVNKRPTCLNGHLSIRDFTLTEKGSYLYINSPIIE